MELSSPNTQIIWTSMFKQQLSKSSVFLQLALQIHQKYSEFIQNTFHGRGDLADVVEAWKVAEGSQIATILRLEAQNEELKRKIQEMKRSPDDSEMINTARVGCADTAINSFEDNRVREPSGCLQIEEDFDTSGSYISEHSSQLNADILKSMLMKTVDNCEQGDRGLGSQHSIQLTTPSTAPANPTTSSTPTVQPLDTTSFQQTTAYTEKLLAELPSLNSLLNTPTNATRCSELLPSHHHPSNDLLTSPGSQTDRIGGPGFVPKNRTQNYKTKKFLTPEGWKCECGQLFRNRKLLEAHRKGCFVCDCKRAFSTRAELYDHCISCDSSVLIGKLGIKRANLRKGMKRRCPFFGQPYKFGAMTGRLCNMSYGPDEAREKLMKHLQKHTGDTWTSLETLGISTAATGVPTFPPVDMIGMNLDGSQSLVTPMSNVPPSCPNISMPPSERVSQDLTVQPQDRSTLRADDKLKLEHTFSEIFPHIVLSTSHDHSNQPHGE